MHPCAGVMPSACRKIKSTRGNPWPQSKGAPKGAPREAFASLNVPVELASQFDEKHIDSLPPVNENLLQGARCRAKKDRVRDAASSTGRSAKIDLVFLRI